MEERSTFCEVEDENIAKFVKSNVEDTEKYKYVKIRSRGKAFYYYCSQRKRSGRDDDAGESRKRVRHVQGSHFCGGFFNFSILKSDIVVFSIGHTSHHEGEIPRHQLSLADLALIHAQAESGMSPYKICAMLHRTSDRMFSWGQVYYRWSEYMKKKYMRSQDPYLSSNILLESCKELSKMLL